MEDDNTCASLAEILLDQHVIAKRIMELGVEIGTSLRGLEPVIMPVLDGGMIFAADLMRAIPLPQVLLPVKASSYGNSTVSSGTVHLPWGIPSTVRDRDLLLVDDILDTGQTLTVLREKLLESGARSVRTCIFLRKESAVGFSADYVAFEIPDRFVVGYGLDLAGRYRNLPVVGIPRSH